MSEHRLDRLRERAESVVDELITRNDVEPWDRERLRQLVHDIRTYHAELEMQNDELRRVQRALEQSRDEYARLFHLSPVGFISVNQQGMVERANDRLLEMAGVARRQLVGGPVANLFFAEDRPGFYSRFKSFFSRPLSQPIELRLLAGNREPRWVTLQAQLESNEERSSGPKLLMTLTDIAALQQARQQAESDHQQALDAIESRTRMIREMSSQIRSPLHTLLGFARLVAGSDLDDPVRLNMQQLIRSAEAIGRISRDHEDLALIDSGAIVLDGTAFHLRDLVEESCRQVGQLALARGTGWSCEIDDSLPRIVRGDTVRMGQLINNLLEYAVVITKSGKIEVVFGSESGSLSTTAAHWLRLSVSVPGKTIDPECLSSLLDPYARNPPACLTGSMGLQRLAIANHLVGVMGGDITVKSGMPGGRGFVVRLPLLVTADLADAGPGAVDSEAEVESSRSTPTQLKLLLLGSDEATMLLLEQQLAVAGHRVEREDGVKGGWEVAVSHGQYDAVIADLDSMLQEAASLLSGLRVRSGGAAEQPVPFLLLTSRLLEGGQETADWDNRSRLLHKPVDSELLLSVLREM